jgi:pilus assembly protein CpaB
MAKKKLIIAAVIVGLAAMGLIWMAVEKQDQKQERLLSNQVKVVKAARNIPAGTRLSRNQITIKKVPKQFLPHNVLLQSDVKVYLGQPLKNDVQEGSMIVTSDFEVEETARTLASKIPKGERAMSLSVDQVSGVSGLINPGDRVDILGTFPVGSKDQVVEQAGGGNVGYITMTLLQNVTILATGTQISSVGGQNKRRNTNYGTVTMSLTVEESELLTIAQTRGDLMLLLRNPDDVKAVTIQRKTLKGVLQKLEIINKKHNKRIKKRVNTGDDDEDESEIGIDRLDENQK